MAAEVLNSETYEFSIPVEEADSLPCKLSLSQQKVNGSSRLEVQIDSLSNGRTYQNRQEQERDETAFSRYVGALRDAFYNKKGQLNVEVSWQNTETTDDNHCSFIVHPDTATSLNTSPNQGTNARNSRQPQQEAEALGAAWDFILTHTQATAITEKEQTTPPLATLINVQPPTQQQASAVNR